VRKVRYTTVSQILSQCMQDIQFYLTSYSVRLALAYNTYIGAHNVSLQALTLMDMNSTNPRATVCISANLELIDATGRKFSISMDYAGSLKVSTPLCDAQYMSVVRVLTFSSSNSKQPYGHFSSMKNHPKIAPSFVLSTRGCMTSAWIQVTK